MPFVWRFFDQLNLSRPRVGDRCSISSSDVGIKFEHPFRANVFKGPSEKDAILSWSPPWSGDSEKFLKLEGLESWDGAFIAAHGCGSNACILFS